MIRLSADEAGVIFTFLAGFAGLKGFAGGIGPVDDDVDDDDPIGTDDDSVDASATAIAVEVSGKELG